MPSNIELFETTIATFWFNVDGILCANSKKVERKVEHYKEIMQLYKFLIETKNINKLCLLGVVDNNMKQDSVVREYIVSEMPKYVKAQALISHKPLDASLSSTFVGLSWNGFPVRLFNNENEAIKWLKEYV